MPIFFPVLCSSSLSHESNTVPRSLECGPYRLRRIEKFLRDNDAPLWTFHPRIFGGDRFAVSRTRFIYPTWRSAHDVSSP